MPKLRSVDIGGITWERSADAWLGGRNGSEAAVVEKHPTDGGFEWGYALYDHAGYLIGITADDYYVQGYVPLGTDDLVEALEEATALLLEE